MELINVWIILTAVDCQVRPCLIGVDHLGWAAAKATAFNLCYCCCRLLLSCCCHRCTTARPWRSTTSSTSSGTSAWRGRSGRRSWETCSRLLCRWRSRMLLIMLELILGFRLIWIFPQDPTELSKNSVGRNKREINLQVMEIYYKLWTRYIWGSLRYIETFAGWTENFPF